MSYHCRISILILCLLSFYSCGNLRQKNTVEVQESESTILHIVARYVVLPRSEIIYTIENDSIHVGTNSYPIDIIDKEKLQSLTEFIECNPWLNASTCIENDAPGIEYRITTRDSVCLWTQCFSRKQELDFRAAEVLDILNKYFVYAYEQACPGAKVRHWFKSEPEVFDPVQLSHGVAISPAFRLPDFTDSQGSAARQVASFSAKPFVREQQGMWICYGYLRNRFYGTDLASKEFAEEFALNSYFIIHEDTLKAQGIYNSSFHAYTYPVDYQWYDSETAIIAGFRPQVDSVIFISPDSPYNDPFTGFTTTPFYQDPPMNAPLLCWDDHIIVFDQGYYYFFRKGEKQIDPRNYGVPGDERNEFRVYLEYPVANVEETLEKFNKDYPYGGRELLTCELNQARLSHHNWNSDNLLMLESTQGNGKFILKIEKTANSMKLEYYNFFGYTENDEYEG